MAKKNVPPCNFCPIKISLFPLGGHFNPSISRTFPTHKKMSVEIHTSISTPSFTWEFSARRGRGLRVQIIPGIYKYRSEISSLITPGQISQVIYSEQQRTLQNNPANCSRISSNAGGWWWGGHRGLSPPLVPLFYPKPAWHTQPGGFGLPPGGSRVIPQELYKILALQIQPEASNPGAAPPQGM